MNPIYANGAIHLADTTLNQLHIGSGLLVCLLTIAAITFLRSKPATVMSTVPLQFLCFALLFSQIASLAFSVGLIARQIFDNVDIIVAGVWFIAMIKLIENGTGRPLHASIKLALFLIWLLTLLDATSTLFSDNLIIGRAQQTAFGLHLLPIIAVALLILFAFGIPSKTYARNIRFFLFGTALYLAGHAIQITATNPSQPGLYASKLAPGLFVVVGALFCLGAIKHPPKQSFSPSRKIAFYGITLASACLFLLLIAVTGAYAQQSASRWASLLQLILIALACLGMVYLSLSSAIRDRIRVYIGKNFFRHKYDYRHVWLNLIKTLSNISDDEDFFRLGLQAVGNIFDADGGALWLKQGEQFELAVDWNAKLPTNLKISESESFIQPFVDEEWIYALSSSGHEAHDRHLKYLPHWIHNIDDVWIVAPLVIGKKLVGFFLLTQSKQNEALIWEDIDVIKSTGRQLASYIVRQQSAEELAESKQFDTYNKLTAFIMHDLKNLIAQQALVVENAQKHKENPAFVEDAIRTIDNSVNRMSHLLKRLQRSSHQSAHRSISVRQIVTEAIRKSADRQPIPTLRGETEDAYIVADQDQIVMVLMHIIRNAQDATKNDGFIDVDIVLAESTVKLEIEDNGCGMDEDFIKNRLFKPFESTKSSMGMGIGAYQVREFIEAMNGKISVSSELDVGTTICVELPFSHVNKP